MDDRIKTARDRLREAIAQADIDPTELARRIGRGRDYIRDLFDERKESLAATAWPEIERELGLERGFLLGDSKTAVGQSATSRHVPDSIGERDFKIFSAAEGGKGEMVVSTEPIDVVPRPWYLRTVKDGYGVVVTGESMSPKYEPGDIVIVNPRLPAIRNKPAIFISDETGGDFKAMVKLLLRETPTEWQVSQLNPKREFALPKKTWVKALRIVGTYGGS